jgi:hypothetical protein
MILTSDDHDLRSRIILAEGRGRPTPLFRRFASRFRRLTANSNSDLSRAQFVPNTARTGGHSWLAMVSPFPLHEGKAPSQGLFGFVFQAGHASSILVTRSKRRP